MPLGGTGHPAAARLFRVQSAEKRVLSDLVYKGSLSTTGKRVISTITNSALNTQHVELRC